MQEKRSACEGFVFFGGEPNCAMRGRPIGVRSIRIISVIISTGSIVVEAAAVVAVGGAMWEMGVGRATRISIRNYLPAWCGVLWG